MSPHRFLFFLDGKLLSRVSVRPTKKSTSWYWAYVQDTWLSWEKTFSLQQDRELGDKMKKSVLSVIHPILGNEADVRFKNVSSRQSLEKFDPGFGWMAIETPPNVHELYDAKMAKRDGANAWRL